jgi:hypothetical protein|tara:strand:- start:2085 stop:2246 length:162 start_codon:yes stop_codon:yes gene_type:complete
MDEITGYDKAVETAKKRAKELFEDVPENIRKELEKETTLGTPENVKDRSDKEE